MQNSAWQKALETSADVQRAGHYYGLLESTSAASVLRKLTGEQARILAALLSGSQSQGELLVSRPDWLSLVLDLEMLGKARRKEGLGRELNQRLSSFLETSNFAEAFSSIREFKQRELLRIAARDLGKLSVASEVILEVSNLADVCLAAVYELATQQMVNRYGRPYHQDLKGKWVKTQSSVIGLGKLGGQELNYSSDVDVMVVYTEEGSVFKEPPRDSGVAGRGLSNHQFFLRLTEAFIAEVTRVGTGGGLFRIDLRLRPEGKAGPLARSLTSYENFYAQWGQTWERMMLLKARPVAGDFSLGAEFLEMVQPFRYPRSINQSVLQEIGAMKERIELEVVKLGEIERNVKLGKGGIREIEFVVQAQQVLHGGKNPFLQDPQTLSGLQKMARYGFLKPDQVEELTRAYLWLRDVEHRLQMDNNRQTHTIPTERRARQRLALLMGASSLTEFERIHRSHTTSVRNVYDGLLKGEDSRQQRELPDVKEGRGDWLKLLTERSFRDPEKAYNLIKEFVHGPGYVLVTSRTSDLALRLLPKLLGLCPTQLQKSAEKTFSAPVLSDPDRVLARLDSFTSAYGARAILYELWTNNPSLFELLLMLFDRSEFLAEIAIRTPDLVDELELSGRLRRSKTSQDTLKDLRHGLNDDDQQLWLRRYHQAELMRIGLRDILGLADYEQNLIELSALADACLAYALEAVMRKHRVKKPPFVIIGLGKLGGAELNYGSDLDLMFVADPKVKNLANLQRMAVDLLDLISAPTELGIAFQTDARLRPDGEKGLLVNSLTAYEEYYRSRAQLWEVQAISRTRPIAGHLELGEKFMEMVKRLTDFTDSGRRTGVSAYSSGWKDEIARMRRRIEKERTPIGKHELAIKTGAGGLIDAEFVAQALCLENGWQEPNTLRALLLARERKALSSGDAELLIDNYRKLRRVEAILRRWSYAGETVLPDDPAPLYRVSVRCGFTSAQHFMSAVGEFRAAIRTVYQSVFGAGK